MSEIILCRTYKIQIDQHVYLIFYKENCPENSWTFLGYFVLKESFISIQYLIKWKNYKRETLSIKWSESIKRKRSSWTSGSHLLLSQFLFSVFYHFLNLLPSAKTNSSKYGCCLCCSIQVLLIPLFFFFWEIDGKLLLRCLFRCWCYCRRWWKCFLRRSRRY